MHGVFLADDAAIRSCPTLGQLGAADTPAKTAQLGALPHRRRFPPALRLSDDGTWLRARTSSAADGGATVDGTSRAISPRPGDRFVFNLFA